MYSNSFRRIDNIVKVRMDPATEEKYKQMERDWVLQINEDLLTAISAGVLANKLLQFANGSVYDEDQNVVHLHDLKFEALDEIVETNKGKPLLVFYNYKHDLERLQNRYKHLNPRELNTAKDKDDWDAGKIEMLLAHPASMGYGLNLQAGGNIIIWFGLNWSLELYLQANARLYRQGQKQTVIVHHLVLENSMDENVMRKLAKKEATQQDLIEAVKARIREVRNGIC